MRIVFLIHRKNYYRLLAPVVEESLRRGYQTECWHDWSQPRHMLKFERGRPRRNGKYYEFPRLDSVPNFRFGVPEIKKFQGAADLNKKFEADPPDVVISLTPGLSDVKASIKTKRLWLQYSVDIRFDQSFHWILSADAVGVYSQYWIDQIEGLDRDSGQSHELRNKLVAVGMPELDGARDIDPEEVRWRLKIPKGPPVVLYLPYPLRSNPQTFWTQQVFRPSTEQAARVIRNERRTEYWPHVRNGWNDRGLVKAVREFCDRNGALLVTKERFKDPAPSYLHDVSLVRDDESLYLPTILKLLRISSLCIHSYSTTVFEAAFCGVPSLCLAPPVEDTELEDYVHNGALGHIYNWPGAAYCTPLREAFDGFRRWRLADFPLDSDARARYVDRFLGFDDDKSSGRFLDMAQVTTEARP